MVLSEYAGPLRPHILKVASLLASKVSNSIETEDLADVLLTTVLLLLLSTFILTALLPQVRNRDKRNAVLLLGISGEHDSPASGKTTLFKTLRYGSVPKHGTVPSMSPNDAIFIPHGASEPFTALRWIDFPGHPRLRHTLHTYLSMAKCVVFVIDAQRFTAQARKDAELLFDALTDPAIAARDTPFLIFCNKTDVAGCAKTVTVRTRLEAELERTRSAHSLSLKSAGVAADGRGNQSAVGEEEDRVALGYEGEPFSFDHARSTVSFASGSAMTGDVDAVINFVRSSFL